MNRTIDFNNIDFNTYNGRVVVDEIYWRAIDDTIIVVEPSVEDTNKIITFIINKAEVNGNQVEFNGFTPEETLKFLLPIMTNIKFDLKDPKQKRLFDLVIKTQPKAIMKVAKHMNDLITDIISDTARITEYLNGLDDESAKKYVSEVKELLE